MAICLFQDWSQLILSTDLDAATTSRSSWGLRSTLKVTFDIFALMWITSVLHTILSVHSRPMLAHGNKRREQEPLASKAAHGRHYLVDQGLCDKPLISSDLRQITIIILTLVKEVTATFSENSSFLMNLSSWRPFKNWEKIVKLEHTAVWNQQFSFKWKLIK